MQSNRSALRASMASVAVATSVVSTSPPPIKLDYAHTLSVIVFHHQQPSHFTLREAAIWSKASASCSRETGFLQVHECSECARLPLLFVSGNYVHRYVARFRIVLQAIEHCPTFLIRQLDIQGYGVRLYLRASVRATSPRAATSP